MTAYDFTRLSSLDFEELTHDLLEAEWSLKLEGFANGRDDGIDLRHLSVDSNLIVQCKHYAGSSFSTLLSNLKRNEKRKIDKLKPSRYVLVTSLPLSPRNKSTLMEALSPYVVSTVDILGATEVRKMLRLHADVERSHFKLWMGSSTVLGKILNAAEHCQTDFKISRIKKNISLYVQTDAYRRALDILNREKVLVISGAPGVGKSTLAEMLLYSHMAEGYEPVVIESAVKEGKSLYRSGKKQIFYFDDFLGQTYIGDWKDYWGKNQDAALADFVAMLRESESGRFILTTRQHILGAAAQKSPKIAYSGLLSSQCILEISDYQRIHRARVLFNHLYFSDISRPYKEAVISDMFFLKVIDHQNFNPRLIEWLTSFIRLNGVLPENYQKFILTTLKNPKEIWRHAFEDQISRASQNILLILYALYWRCDLEVLEETWKVFHLQSAKKYNFEAAPNDFRRGLKEIEGGFIEIEDGRIHFVNPSVRDFLGALYSENPEHFGDMIDAAQYFQQIGSIWRLVESRNDPLFKFVHANTERLANGLGKIWDAPWLQLNKLGAWYRSPDGDIALESVARLALELAASTESDRIVALAKNAIDALIFQWDNSWVSAVDSLDFLKLVRRVAPLGVC